MKTLERFPPTVVRMLARIGRGNGSRIMTTLEISRASGLPIRRVQQIARSTTWNDVRVGDMLRFMRACRFSPDATRRQSEYLRRALDPTRTRIPGRRVQQLGLKQPSARQLVVAALGQSTASVPSASSSGGA